MAKCEIRDCPLWRPNQEECDDCVDGRFIEAVSEYASTCDGCGELTHHNLLTMDEETQLGYCYLCAKERGMKPDDDEDDNETVQPIERSKQCSKKLLSVIPARPSGQDLI